ncbi:hypothetical protein VTI74DRAFT_2918 [Chaetomium olivicolor]
MCCIKQILTALSVLVLGYTRANEPRTAPPSANAPTGLLSDADLPLWLRLLFRICLWAKNLDLVGRLYEEFRIETFEEFRLEFDDDASALLPPSSVLRPREPRAPASFPKFPLLPPEIRHMVWNHAIPGPRLLLLQAPSAVFVARDSSPVDTCLRSLSRLWPRSLPRLKRNKAPFDGFTCRTPPPALLHVNSESRAIALNHYRLGLAAVSRRGPPRASQPRVYINPNRDVIGVPLSVMRTSRARKLFRSTPDLKKFKSFCIPTPVGTQEMEIVERFLSRTSTWKVIMNKGEEVLLVDSATVAQGMVPRLAGRDWEYWVRWMVLRECAGWMVRRGYWPDENNGGNGIGGSVIWGGDGDGQWEGDDEEWGDGDVDEDAAGNDDEEDSDDSSTGEEELD